LTIKRKDFEISIIFEPKSNGYLILIDNNNTIKKYYNFEYSIKSFSINNQVIFKFTKKKLFSYFSYKHS